jgi:hypothetical protein
MHMKKIIVLYVLFLAGGLTAGAQTNPSGSSFFGDRPLSMALQIGTDIGGAIPFPLKHVPGTMNAFPHLNVSIGGKFGFLLYEHFSLGMECTYKRVAMAADARLENQKFQGEGMVQYFSGTAEMNMAFTMLEVPLYVRYQFGHSSHRVLLGGYYAYAFSSKFETLAKKGFIGSEPDVVDSPVMPEDPVEMVFSEELGNWDAGLILGYELQLISNLHLGLRFSMGFKDIFKSGTQYFDYSMLHMRGTVVMSYNLVTLGKSAKKYYSP